MSAGFVDLRLPGVRVGHWTDEVARTGCTVVLLPEGAVASGEVRGGAPATREFALLDPSRSVAAVDAVVLTGGSAFGLAAADGVMEVLEAAGRGVATTAGRVPIVVAMGIFDLGVGDGSVRPGAGAGIWAAEAAAEGPVAVGAVGAGAGATVGKWQGPGSARPGGLGAAGRAVGSLVVSCLVAVNALGDIGGHPTDEELEAFGALDPLLPGEATTIAVVLTNASLDKAACRLVAESAHDGFARALFPAHTRGDGDAVVAASVGPVEVPVDRVRALAVLVTEAAIRSVGADR